YQWMLEQKGEVIKERLARREIPFTDIIKEFGFSSPSHFTVYCRKQFGETPSRLRKQLMREAREGN
ncbi:MAG: helix-turn-helix domain-containing protein, partial [Porphyromonas sp.]|nr:helix-turn-helix domain-containing protein [Porphyromonas sp.]